MELIRGLSYIKSLKISGFLFSQLAKYGILIRDHYTVITKTDLNSINKSNYKFFITDQPQIPYCKEIVKNIYYRFFFLYNLKDSRNIFMFEKCNFMPILASPLRTHLIASQLLSHFRLVHKESGQRMLAFKDSVISTIRVVLKDRFYFTLSILPDSGYLEYRGFSVHLSKKETNLMEQLSVSYKGAVNTCVSFPEYSNKQLTNGISRLRIKIKSINIPVHIKNNYGKGYCLTVV